MKKFFYNNSFKKIVLLIILFSIYIFISAYSYVSQVSYDLSDSVFRLHIVANSNSIEDQSLKYVVRDNIINYMNELCMNTSSKEETIDIVSKHIDDFTQIANNTISENGFDYQAHTELGNFEFPTKNYADISFPSGYYDALKIQLGNAEGQNWWCVLYPSLCFVDITSGYVPDSSKEELKTNLSDEEYKILSDTNNIAINFKFKLVELFAQKGLLTAKK